MRPSPCPRAGERLPGPPRGRDPALLAERHGVAPEQVVLGNGAAQFLQGPAPGPALRGRRGGDALAVLPALPADGRRARAKPVSVATKVDDAHPLRVAGRGGYRAHPRARDLQPNDPTGHITCRGRVGRLLAVLPERVHVLLDEALVHFQDAEEQDACLRLGPPAARTSRRSTGCPASEPAYRCGHGRDTPQDHRALCGRERSQPGRGGARAAHRRRRGAPARAVRCPSSDGCSRHCAA